MKTGKGCVIFCIIVPLIIQLAALISMRNEYGGDNIRLLLVGFVVFELFLIWRVANSRSI